MSELALLASSSQNQEILSILEKLPECGYFLELLSEMFINGSLLPIGTSTPKDGSSGTKYSLELSTYVAIIRSFMGVYLTNDAITKLLVALEIDTAIKDKDYVYHEEEDTNKSVLLYAALTARIKKARFELSQYPKYCVEGYHHLLPSAAPDAEAASDTKKPAAEKKSSAAVSSTAATGGGSGLKTVKKGKGAKKREYATLTDAANAGGSGGDVFVCASDVSNNGNGTTAGTNKSKKRKTKDKKSAGTKDSSSSMKDGGVKDDGDTNGGGKLKGTDKYATPAKHTNTTPSEEHATPSEEEEEEILCIKGIQAEIQGCFSGAGTRNKLRTHVTPQVEKWSATPGMLAANLKLVEESAKKVVGFKSREVVDAVTAFKDDLATRFAELREAE